MNNILIVFSSSTSANRLKKIAGRHGLSGIDIIQTPKSLSKDGCTYSIKTDAKNLTSLYEISKKYEIKHGKVYREYTDVEGKRAYSEM